MVISIYVFSFWGLHPQTPTRARPLDPAGVLLSSDPVLSPSETPLYGRWKSPSGVQEKSPGSIQKLKPNNKGHNVLTKTPKIIFSMGVSGEDMSPLFPVPYAPNCCEKLL